MSSGTFDTVLVANRGEAALRIARGARRLGLRVVGVFSDADSGSPALGAMDEVVRIGGAPPAESYLSVGGILEAARATGAGAIHPGWGFLAENPEMARACEGAGLVWVGPDASTIERMGDKDRARREMAAAGLPVLPGRLLENDTEDEARAAIDELGLPVLIKAVAGGGGRGLRRVESVGDLSEALLSARREAEGAFGDDRLLLERWVSRARHVEVQVLGTADGRILHLGDRDCTLQRRHQKLVEEAPAPGLSDELRGRIREIGVRVAREVAYRNAGTVELLLDLDSEEVWFLEMNTRLQVEHPVTEEVAGVDLVELQLRVAAGELLPFAQEDVELRGHAIEARLIAEDPAADFRPESGTLEVWRPPGGEGIRVDHALADGTAVPPWYDSLLAKIVARGETREEARRRLVRALDETVALGIVTNREALRRMLEHADVVAGRHDTGWVERSSAELSSLADDPESRALAAFLLSVDLEVGAPDPWRSTGTPAAWRVDMEESGTVRTVELEARSDREAPPGSGAFALHLRARDEDGSIELGLVRSADGELRCVRPDGASSPVRFRTTDRRVHLRCGRRDARFERIEPLSGGTSAAGATGGVAPLAGRVSRVEVEVGDRVEIGDRLVAIDSMKMETWIVAPIAGEVADVATAVDRQVRSGELLVGIEPEPDGPDVGA